MPAVSLAFGLDEELTGRRVVFRNIVAENWDRYKNGEPPLIR